MKQASKSIAFDNPCGTWNKAPIGLLIPWTIVTEELLNAIPASKAAIDISSLAFKSFGVSKAIGKYLNILFTAETAKLSESGCAFLDV